MPRRAADHLAFGWGEHVCVGMHLARLEMNALLETPADRVARFGILDRRPLIDNGLRGPDRLDVAIEPATERYARTIPGTPARPGRQRAPLGRLRGSGGGGLSQLMGCDRL
ncbi:cytochrome P450 [Nocardia sp. NPDC003963]